MERADSELRRGGGSGEHRGSRGGGYLPSNGHHHGAADEMHKVGRAAEHDYDR